MSNQRGDTIIEVILASAMLALVTVSSFAIMQRASSSAYDAMERSSVRMLLNEQIELLTYFRDQYAEAKSSGSTITAGSPAAHWQTISSVYANVASVPTPETCAAPANAFSITRTATAYQLQTSNTAATAMPSAGNGLWVAKVAQRATQKRYAELYVVACWQSTTSGESRMSSVVRLYDPL